VLAQPAHDFLSMLLLLSNHQSDTMVLPLYACVGGAAAWLLT
jgi:hypothetical protein